MKKFLFAFGLYLLAALPASAGVTCSLPFILLNGTTADATQVMANFNALKACFANNTAKSGVNADITSLQALNVPLTVSQGGTGLASITAGYFLVGNGTSAVSQPFTTYGVHANIGQLITSNTTIDNTMCSKTLVAGGAATFLLTLPASISGFPTNCNVRVTNSNSANGVVLSGFSAIVTNRVLYPLQTLEIEIVNGAWRTAINPGRWRKSGINFYASNSGDDTNNDCITVSTPCKTIGSATLRLYQETDSNNGTPQVTIACGQYNESLNIQGPIVGSAVWFLFGASATPHCVDWRNATALNGTSLLFGDLATLEIKNIWFECSGCTGVNYAIFAHQSCIIDILYDSVTGGKVEFGEMGGGYHIFSDGMSKINMPAQYIISGGAIAHVHLEPYAYMTYSGGVITVTVANTPTFTYLYDLIGSFVNAPTMNFSAAITAGQQWQARSLALISQAGVTWPAGSTAGNPAVSVAPYGAVAQ